ncbi:ATP-sensitive inward rectifier potassium channel 12-like [Uranotaenia lowii]|uniref:ATP-sensitive inward rectifier potassium channel 12-like n=1 Tax=Uranotaenia lowii TaxID=190385 RepID=UPI0024786452|nr:ATP-sensitive inward rectifier potassium channel 12-like [Uranotaenia lowii]
MYANRCRNLNPPRIDIEAANSGGSVSAISGQQPGEDSQRLLSPTHRSDRLSPLSADIRSTASGQLTPRSSGRRPGAYRPSVFAHRQPRRAVFKNGYCNITHGKYSRKGIRYLQDMFTTLVDARWRYTLMVFAMGFVLSWLFFGAVYWFICYAHGDLEEAHLPHNQEENGWTPCVVAIYSFTSCFLFSLETQHTIGYGSRATTEECPEAVFVMSLQSVHGVMIQALLAGIVFAKMTRSKSRSQTLLFSKSAVICQRDGELNLMFRVADMRKSHIIGANIRAQLIRSKVTREGESVAQYQIELDLGVDGGGPDLFFIWPQIVCHKIDAKSPLWNMSAIDMMNDRFEIVVILEGTIESTGQSTQARSSYLNSEIIWGYRFEPVLFYNRQRQKYEINFSKFDAVVPMDVPVCSAKDMTEGIEYCSQDDLVDKRPEFTNLFNRLQSYHLENEHSFYKSAYLVTETANALTVPVPPPRSRSSNGIVSMDRQMDSDNNNGDDVDDKNIKCSVV